jgi:serine acetyltransferase
MSVNGANFLFIYVVIKNPAQYPIQCIPVIVFYVGTFWWTVKRLGHQSWSEQMKMASMLVNKSFSSLWFLLHTVGHDSVGYKYRWSHNPVLP